MLINGVDHAVEGVEGIYSALQALIELDQKRHDDLCTVKAQLSKALAKIEALELENSVATVLKKTVRCLVDLQLDIIYQDGSTFVLTLPYTHMTLYTHMMFDSKMYQGRWEKTSFPLDVVSMPDAPATEYKDDEDNCSTRSAIWKSLEEVYLQAIPFLVERPIKYIQSSCEGNRRVVFVAL
jgi:hypothetical protein